MASNMQKYIKYLISLWTLKLRNYENKILFYLKKHKISFICLAGFMKIIPEKLIKIIETKL